MELWNEALIARKGLFCVAAIGPRHDALLFSRKPIIGNDWSGYKIRTPDPLLSTFVQKMGGAPTPIPSPELLEALGKGIVDGMLRPPQDAYKNKEYEYVPYMLGPTFMPYFTWC